MSSHPLHAAHDGAGAGTLPPNTLRKDSTRLPPSSVTSVASTKSKLVKNRAVSSENDASGSTWHSQSPGSSTSTVTARNRLKKSSGTGPQQSIESYHADSDIIPKLPLHQPSTSNSPTAPRNFNSLPSTTSATTSTASTAQPSSSRPVPLRTQSYSKRHASFDTPREVPLPSLPPGQEGLPTFDDSEQERGKNWYQQQSRQAGGTQRRLSVDVDTAPSVQPPISVLADTVTQSSSEDCPSLFPQPPQFPRNNSAPTPPRTPGAERVDLRLRNDPPPELENRSEGSSSGNVTDSDDTPPMHSLASQDPLSLGRETPGKWTGSRGDKRGIHMDSSDSRLSSTSLPLPHAYGAERVSRLPSTSRHNGTPSLGGHASISLASETPPVIPEGQVVQNIPPTSHTISEPSSAMGYRSSYPTAPIARNVPLTTDLPSPLLQSPTPGTAFRFSASSLPRQFLVDDEDEREAIKRGHTPKLPEIEAPKAVLHPLLTTPSRSTHTMESAVENSKVESSRDSRNSIGSPSASTTDRTSTASGSSGVSSEVINLNRPVSESIKGSWMGGSPISRLRNPRPSTTGAEHTTVSTISPLSTGQTRQSLPEANGMQSVPAGPVMTVETTPSSYVLQASLPGYQRDEITISTRKKRILHVVADGFVSGGGHFERRVSFGYDADMMRVRAEFNGSSLKITVPRRPTPQSFAASLNTSSSANGNSPYGASSNSMFWRGRSNII